MNELGDNLSICPVLQSQSPTSPLNSSFLCQQKNGELALLVQTYLHNNVQVQQHVEQKRELVQALKEKLEGSNKDLQLLRQENAKLVEQKSQDFLILKDENEKLVELTKELKEGNKDLQNSCNALEIQLEGVKKTLEQYTDMHVQVNLKKKTKKKKNNSFKSGINSCQKS